MKDQSITRIMTPDPLTVGPEETAAAAYRTMRKARCHHLPVVTDGVLVGMLGRSDLIKALIPPNNREQPLTGEALLEARRVESVMSRHLVTVPQQSTLLDAVRALSRGDLHALPVVAPGDVLVGLVTSSDLVEALRDSLVHPVAEPDARPELPFATAPDPEGRRQRALMDLYRAVGHFLHSGRGELENSRLLRAFGNVRELLERPEIGI
ncbi:MAG: CBS domain-containing protein [Gammaproteobacteria bacterium]|nr:CBS domain-containing protein [Gammaproteobacteria bacterium]